jgi:hypothetical protein
VDVDLDGVEGEVVQGDRRHVVSIFRLNPFDNRV